MLYPYGTNYMAPKTDFQLKPMFRYYPYYVTYYPMLNPIPYGYRYYDHLLDQPRAEKEVNQIIPLQHGPERLEERHPHTKHVEWASMFPNEVFLQGPTGPKPRKEVALTFDDGPDNVWTPRILDVLAQYKIKATFMCVGARIKQNPHVLQRIAREGHVVGNASWSHPNLTKIPLSEVREQIETTSDEIERLTSFRPRFFRPPYGALNEDVIKEILSLNYKILLWNVDSLDWAGLTSSQVAANILSHVEPASIILQHCAGGHGESLVNTVEALPNIIQTLRNERYFFIPVPDLLFLPAYQ